MLRVETVFTSYHCARVKQDVDVRVDRLRDVESNRILSQKFECDRAGECCLNESATAELPAGCPHPDAKHMTARRERSAGS